MDFSKISDEDLAKKLLPIFVRTEMSAREAKEFLKYFDSFLDEILTGIPLSQAFPNMIHGEYPRD